MQLLSLSVLHVYADLEAILNSKHTYTTHDKWIKITLNFKPGNEMKRKSELINMTQVWEKRKNPSPHQKSNPWPPEHRVGLLSTELWELNGSIAI